MLGKVASELLIGTVCENVVHTLFQHALLTASKVDKNAMSEEQDIVWRSTVDTLPDIVPEGFVLTPDYTRSRTAGPTADSLRCTGGGYPVSWRSL